MIENKKPGDLDRITHTWGAISLSFSPWWSPYRTFSKSEKETTARALEMEDETWISGPKKKIINTSHRAWKALNSFRDRVQGWWDWEATMPYVVSGQRLFVVKRREEILYTLDTYRGELLNLTQHLTNARRELLEETKKKLGSSFSEDFLPASWAGMFGMVTREHNISPPDYLLEVSEQAYREEVKRRLAEIQASGIIFESQCMERMAQAIYKITNVIEEIAEPGQVGGGAYRSTNASISTVQGVLNRIITMKFEGTALFKKVMKEVDSIFQEVDAQGLRKDEGLRTSTKERLEKLVGSHKELSRILQEKNKE